MRGSEETGWRSRSRGCPPSIRIGAEIVEMGAPLRLRGALAFVVALQYTLDGGTAPLATARWRWDPLLI